MPFEVSNMNLSIQVFNTNEKAVIYTYAFDVERPLLRKRGIQTYQFIFPDCKLYQDNYYLKVHLAETREVKV